MTGEKLMKKLRIQIKAYEQTLRLIGRLGNGPVPLVGYCYENPRITIWPQSFAEFNRVKTAVREVFGETIWEKKEPFMSSIVQTISIGPLIIEMFLSANEHPKCRIVYQEKVKPAELAKPERIDKVPVVVCN